MVAARVESSAAESCTSNFAVDGRGHQHVHAVVAARAALLDHQLLAAAGIAVEPHRAGLIGLDAQRLRLGERAVAYGDRALPHAVRRRRPRRSARACRRPSPHAPPTPTARPAHCDRLPPRPQPCGRQTASLRCSRTSVSDHRRPRRWCNIQKSGRIIMTTIPIPPPRLTEN